MNLPSTQPSNDVPDELNEWFSSDDDDLDSPAASGGHAEAPQEDLQESHSEAILDDSSPEGEISQYQEQNEAGAGESPQFGPEDRQNQGSSRSPVDEAAGNSPENNLEVSSLSQLPMDLPSTTQSAPPSTPRPTAEPSESNKKAIAPTAVSSRPVRERKAPDRIHFHENYGKRPPKHGANLAHTKAEPLTYEEAMNGPDRREWKLSVGTEFEAHFANNTWELVHLPTGRKVITCKWVFKIKYNPDGTIHRYKSRLITRGFTQLKSIDYHKTFAPTLRFESLRLLFAIAAYLDLLIHQLDVNNAYLNSHLEEKVYMKLPPGFPITERTRGIVLRLRKGLYDLK